MVCSTCITILPTLQQQFCLNKIIGMNDFDAYKNTHNKCKKEKTIKSHAHRMGENGGVSTFLEAIENIKLSEKVMGRKERMERLSLFGRGNLADLVDFNHYEIEDLEGGIHKQSCWLLKDSEDIPNENLYIISELSTSASGLKIKIQDRTTAIRELNDMDKSPDLDDEQSDVTITDVINDITGAAQS